MEDRILEKIRKLLALATSSNEHEAALAAAKAQALLFEHNLTESQVMGHAAAREAQQQAYGQDRWESGTATWRLNLINALAANNFCKAIYLGKGHVSVIGKAHNAEVVRFMFDYLTREIDRLAALAKKRRELEAMFDDAEPIRKPAVWLNNFRLGAVNTIADRLREQSSRNRYQSAQADALVVVSGQELARAVNQAFPRLHNTRRHYQGDSDGFAAGKAAGQSIGLHAGALGGGNVGGRRLLGDGW